MKLINRLPVFVTSLALVAVAACDVAPNPDGKVYDVGVTSSALHDGFTTPFQPDIATAITSNRVFNVWIAQTSTGDQVVGQMFDLTGAPIGPSRVYTNTTHRKYEPSVSYGSLGRFLIVYMDAYSSTDDDILGIIVDNTGAIVSSPQIDFTTNVDLEPKVTFVPTGINQWVVTYQRNGSPNAIMAAFFDSAGTRGTSATITTSTQSLTGPQVQYSISTQRLMFAWSGAGNSGFLFTSTALALGPVSVLPLAANHNNLWPSIAYQPNTENMGLAYWDELLFDATTSRDHLLILPRGCESISCVLPEKSTGISGSSPPINGVNRPQLTVLGSSFVIQNPVFGSFTNGETIRLTVLNGDNGVVTSSTNQSIPACSGALVGGDYGSSGWSLFTAGTTAGVSLIYDAFCETTTKIRGQLLNTSLTRTNYNVSD